MSYPLSELLVCQKQLKRPSVVKSIINEHNKKQEHSIPKIKLALTEDGNYTIHDGHHRAFALLALGYTELTSSEADLTNHIPKPTCGTLKDLFVRYPHLHLTKTKDQNIKYLNI